MNFCKTEVGKFKTETDVKGTTAKLVTISNTKQKLARSTTRKLAPLTLAVNKGFFTQVMQKVFVLFSNRVDVCVANDLAPAF